MRDIRLISASGSMPTSSRSEETLKEPLRFDSFAFHIAQQRDVRELGRRCAQRFEHLYVAGGIADMVFAAHDVRDSKSMSSMTEQI